MSNPVGAAAVYGKSATGANVAIAETGATSATGTLTFSGQPANGETLTINGRVYTFVTALTGNVNGQTTGNQILIGANTAASITNAVAAISKTPGSDGTLYSYGTAQNTSVTATGDATHIVITAIQIGSDGNSITTTENIANASWGAATLTGGVSGALVVTGPGSGGSIVVTSPAVTENPVALGASVSQIIPVGAKSWAAVLLTGTGTINGVALPLNVPVSGGTLAATVTIATGTTSSAFVLYET